VAAERDAVEIAARALRHRDRSRRELEARLTRAGVPEPERAEALETLERVGWVDDGRFAAARAEALAGRGYGDAAIRQVLEGEGVAAELVQEAVAALEPEQARAERAIARLGATARTGAALLRKGFGEESVEAAFRRVGADGAGSPFADDVTWA
jgi:regulatory protein